jgi:hypothetical protein
MNKELEREAWVYLLEHEYVNRYGEEEFKVLGVFATRHAAHEAKRKAARLPGFRRYPKGFIVSKMVVGRLSWAEGFVTLRPPKRLTEEESLRVLRR